MHSEQSYLYLLRKLPCLDHSEFFHFKLGDSRKRIAIIRPAPEPEDIIWTNLGQYQGTMIKKKMLTFGVTVLVLVASFWIIYGLTILQYHLSNNKELRETTNILISILISLCISIENVIIQRNC
jgi:hypothetical protein